MEKLWKQPLLANAHLKKTPWIFFQELKKDKFALISLAVLIAMGLIAVSGQLLIEEVTVLDLTRIGRRPSQEFWLGTDMMGRDLFQRLILALGNSLAAALLATTISTAIGLLVGAIGGYYGGTFDRAIVWLIDLIGIAPSFILTLALFSLLFAPTTWQIAWIISLSSWPTVARLIRSKTLQEKEMDYIHASVTVGTSKWKILWGQILPQLLPLVVAGFFLNLGASIGIETGVSYLGFGFPHAVPSIGGMIGSGGNIRQLFARPWVWLPAAASVFVFMLAAHHIGQFLIRLATPDLRK